MGPFQPPRPQGNGKNAAIFFMLTLVVFALPLLMPNHRSHPAFTRTSSPRPSVSSPEAVAIAAPTSSPSAEASASPSVSASPSTASTNMTSSPAGPSAPVSAAPQPVASAATVPSVASVSASPKPGEAELDWNQDYGPQINFKEKLQSIIVNLFIITGLIFLTVKFLQKFYPNIGKVPTQNTPLMQVLSSTTISPGINLCLVQVCNKNMVLAITEHSVSTICEISEEELAKARENSEVPQDANGPVISPLAKSPKQVYGDILRHYLSIIPGVGGKQ